MVRVTKEAYISECGRYRYWLMRSWGAGKKLIFVMLNPSTADALIDDPTIKRCMGFARREGFDGILVLNLFAYRATNPKELEGAAFGLDITGSENARFIHLYMQLAVEGNIPVVCAWGSNKAVDDSGERFIEHAETLGVKVVCLGQTKSGAPKHPLYISSEQPLVPYVRY